MQQRAEGSMWGDYWKKKCNTWDTEESFVSQHMTNTCSGQIIVPPLSIRNENRSRGNSYTTVLYERLDEN